MYLCFRLVANSVCHYRRCVYVCVQTGRLGSLLQKKDGRASLYGKAQMMMMMPTSFLALFSNWQSSVDSRAQLHLKDHWLKTLVLKRGDGWEVLLLNTHMDIVHGLRVMAYFFSSYSI